jgi:hypothetical protein
MGLDAEAMIVVPGYGDHLQATADPGIRERQAGAPTEFADAIGDTTKLFPGERPHWHVTMLMKSRDRVAEEAGRPGGTVLDTADERWSSKAPIRTRRAPCSASTSSACRRTDAATRRTSEGPHRTR